MFPLESMGETAENVAERYGVTREDQDAFALEVAARAGPRAGDARGRFADELVPVGRRSSTSTSTRGPTRRREARRAEAGLPRRAAR